MSQENVEAVRRGYEHLRQTGEFPWELIDPAVEVHDPPIGPDSQGLSRTRGNAHRPCER
jgi:hypothetical protein